MNFANSTNLDDIFYSVSGRLVLIGGKLGISLQNLGNIPPPLWKYTPLLSPELAISKIHGRRQKCIITSDFSLITLSVITSSYHLFCAGLFGRFIAVFIGQHVPNQQGRTDKNRTVSQIKRGPAPGTHVKIKKINYLNGLINIMNYNLIFNH